MTATAAAYAKAAAGASDGEGLKKVIQKGFKP
jgi:hypothetical protein